MRALVLSDIHGNLEALTAVLDAAGHWDALWNLGDMVGYGASPNEVLQVVRPLATLTVRGNHDRVCCGPDLDAELQSYRAGGGEVDDGGAERGEPGVAARAAAGAAVPGAADAGEARVALAHGSPLNEDQYIQNMRDAWAPLRQMTTAITFVGHTHIQGGFAQKEHDWHELRPRYPSRAGSEMWTLAIAPGMRCLINPGAVGQPRDFDWRAAFAIYDGEANEVAFHRVPYDVAKAQGRVRKARAAGAAGGAAARRPIVAHPW